jgi:DNA replication protein DnaC
MQVRNTIKTLGKEMYGEMFSLDDENVFKSYEKVYNIFLKNHFGKSKKGVLVIGNIGAGKSALMKIMQRVFKDSKSKFRLVNAYDLKDLSEIYTISQIKEMYGFDLKHDLYIDDIGFSVDVKRYGNTVNIITEILMDRYDLFVSTGIKTHLSSNIMTHIVNDINNKPTLKIIYGARIVDRIKEMCEVIIFKGNSQRV